MLEGRWAWILPCWQLARLGGCWGDAGALSRLRSGCRDSASATLDDAEAPTISLDDYGWARVPLTAVVNSRGPAGAESRPEAPDHPRTPGTGGYADGYHTEYQDQSPRDRVLGADVGVVCLHAPAHQRCAMSRQREFVSIMARLTWALDEVERSPYEKEEGR